MKTGKTYWETEQIGQKERQRENRLGRERERQWREKTALVDFDRW